jgi:hypothetical protein
MLNSHEQIILKNADLETCLMEIRKALACRCKTNSPAGT